MNLRRLRVGLLFLLLWCGTGVGMARIQEGYRPKFDVVQSLSAKVGTTTVLTAINGWQ